MKSSIFVIALMVFFLTACGSADMGTPQTEDCELGLDGNGNCIQEGTSPIPLGGH
jgi:hypothetical protein